MRRDQHPSHSTLRLSTLAALVLSLLVFALIGSAGGGNALAAPTAPQATIGGVNLGDLTNYLVFVSDGSGKAKIQSASDGYTGDWAVNGTVATEETSGSFGYAGTIYTNDTGAGAVGKAFWTTMSGELLAARIIPHWSTA